MITTSGKFKRSGMYYNFSNMKRNRQTKMKTGAHRSFVGVILG